jgi:hypothetical protein
VHLKPFCLHAHKKNNKLMLTSTKDNNNINWVTWFLTLQKLELEVENDDKVKQMSHILSTFKMR